MLISVLLTTYNSEETIQRALDSVFQQNGLGKEFELELLVVDDCSTDQTREILAQNDVSFIVNEQNSGGPNLGRNKLLEMAKGDFITLIDHDDSWQADKIRTFIKHKDVAPILSSGYRVLDITTGKKRAVKNDGKEVVLFKKNETFKRLLAKQKGGQITYLGSIFFSSKIQIPRFETHYGRSDYDWLLQLFYGNASAELSEQLYTRYVDGQNLSLNEVYRRQDLETSIKAIEYFLGEYPQEAKKGIKRSYGTMARYYYLIGNMRASRHYFKRASHNWKTILYYLTTYGGSNLVKRYFNVFG